MAGFQYPTGYEDELRSNDTRRKLAELMVAKGLTDNPNMTSWLQVLGQIGTGFAGDRMMKRADRRDSELNDRMVTDYAEKMSAFSADAKTLSPKELVQKYQGDPVFKDALRPYANIMVGQEKEGGKIVKFQNTMGPASSFVGQQDFDPNEGVIPDGNGGFKVNPVKTAASMLSQGIPPNGGGTIPGAMSMPHPLGQPEMGSVGAPPAPGTPDPSAPIGGPPASPISAGGLDLSLLSPEERDILQSELMRRSGAPSYELQTDTSTPMGSPLSAAKAPAGVTVDGKPFWVINGVPYDNPEGK